MRAPRKDSRVVSTNLLKLTLSSSGVNGAQGRL